MVRDLIAVALRIEKEAVVVGVNQTMKAIVSLSLVFSFCKMVPWKVLSKAKALAMGSREHQLMRHRYRNTSLRSGVRTSGKLVRVDQRSFGRFLKILVLKTMKQQKLSSWPAECKCHRTHSLLLLMSRASTTECLSV